MSEEIKEVETVETEVEVKPQIKMGAVILITHEGQIEVQDAKPLFDNNVDELLNPVILDNAIKELARQIERREVINAVKHELAASFTGGKK